MRELALSLAFLGLENLGGVLAVVLGFGALVFVHELGHFLAAKWCGVRVEVFSVGFGPRIFGFQRGGTDYRISWLPLGGYVKMLGQDDSDPDTPRTGAADDFRNKPASSRFVILIAGVLMNTVFAVIAFVVAFALGAEFTAPEVGGVVLNGAASRARVVARTDGPLRGTEHQGLLEGDQILSINGTAVYAFEDVQTIVALSREKLLLDVARTDSATGTVERLTLEATTRRLPDDPFPRLGVWAHNVVAEVTSDSPLRDKVEKNDELVDAYPAGTASTAALASGTPPLEHVRRIASENPGKPLQVVVLRRRYDEDGRPLAVPPQRLLLEATPVARPVYDVGIEFADAARIQEVLDDSPAKGSLEPGDLLLSVAGREVKASTLRDVLREAGGTPPAGATPDRSVPVELVFERRVPGKEPERRTARVALARKPNDEGWILSVRYADDRVLSVREGSPAAVAGIKPGDFLTDAWPDRFLGIKWRDKRHADRAAVEQLVAEKKDQKWLLGWQSADGKEHFAAIAAVRTEQSRGDLGVGIGPRPIVLRRDAAGACSLGLVRTVRTFEHLVLTIRGLFARQVSTRELGGPIQIATITFKIAQGHGLGKLIYFLAILSVNLAVLNVLPIPVLDGGHIFLLVLEKLKGRPLSDDLMRYVQYGGLAFIVGLMLYVTWNDIRRFWFE